LGQKGAKRGKTGQKEGNLGPNWNEKVALKLLGRQPNGAHSPLAGPSLWRSTLLASKEPQGAHRKSKAEEEQEEPSERVLLGAAEPKQH